MPGIEELKKFREEIAAIGNERKIIEERGETYEELPLPKEPAGIVSDVSSIDVDNLLASIGADVEKQKAEGSPFDMIQTGGVENASGSGSSQVTDFSGISLDSESDKNNDSASDVDLAALDAMLASLPLGDPSDLSGENQTAPSPASGNGAATGNAEESGVKIPDISAGNDMSDSLEKDSSDSGSGDIPSGDFDFSNFSMPDLPDDFGSESGNNPVEDADVISVSGDEKAGDAFSGETPVEEPGTGFSDTPPEDGDFSVDAGFEMPVQDAGEEKEAASDSFASMPDIPDISDFSFGGDSESSSPEEQDAESLPDFDFNVGDTSIPDFPSGDLSSESPLDGALAGDTEDSGKFDVLDGLAEDSDSVTGKISEEEKSESKVDKSDLDDFDGLQDLDGFEFDEKVLNAAIRNSSSADTVPGYSDYEKDGTGGKTKPGKTVKKEIPTEISEEEFERFLQILSRFPLNLRLAVEEYLSSGEGTDPQKMELVSNILNGLPLRKTANILEKHLDRSITIPKDFEKKNFEEYELEKTSLKYVFFNKILPMTVMSAIALVLTACIVFLSYQFIYRPVSAEGLYKRGFQAIQDERYTQSMELFDQAVQRWEKKRWYFTYARGYRDKNQYISAETMYTRLLDRYNNDLDGGLEYAEMLRTDLRNFEKAETILRRRVLDYHINNLDGLLLLGDVFLDWAEEDPEKYELARIQYASASEIYGPKDPILVRMMRYFIRTNNLAEVLPLKEHFMNKRAKIGAGDLIELGGYLLEKRYMPSAGDSDVLRDAIGDLRTILERGVTADPSIPEGHYNMGRFYIFNYKEDLAAVSLNESLRLFPDLKQASPRRVVTNVDAYRLLGEIRAGEKEYINAQDLYAAGISLYETRRAARSVPQDPRVGQLYADYADIDYFISNDWDSAFDNYSKAASELYDTPSVRYKMGYIQYQKQNYEDALRFFVRSYGEVNTDGNILFSLGNTLFRRGSYNAARGYYERLMEMSEAERIRKGILLPQIRSDHGSFVEQYMHTSNNLGVTLYNISLQTGRKDLQGRAYALFSESARAWDALTRNPDTMIRAQGANLAYLNMQNITAPSSSFSPEIYTDIPKVLTGEKVLQSRLD